ncbi:GTPase HflX [bacterium]|jgi:GTPase|nr:GTPase HflX [bacterium]
MIQTTDTVLLAIDNKRTSELWSASDSVEELRELCENLGYSITNIEIQARERPHPKFYVGSGKLQELKELYKESNIGLFVTDDDLTPLQHRTLEAELAVKVMDRTGIILEIFAMRANTKEAQLQVEFAQLTYLKPRLTRMWTHLSRLGGGIGTKGPGEKQLEVDKRQIRNRMDTIKEKLLKIEKQRGLKRERRQTTPILTGSIVGYTNAGKSTLLNSMTESSVVAESKLFATLDPTTKTFRIPSNEKVLLTDTVGFIQKLPNPLKTSFKATLEEINEANFILHVVDISNPNWESMLKTSEVLLEDLGANKIPTIYVFNKIDLVTSPSTYDTIHNFHPNVCVSASKKESLSKLLDAIQKLLDVYQKEYVFRIPLNRMEIVHLLHQHGKVLEEEYEEIVTIKVKINKIIAEKIMGQLEKKRV